MTEPRARSPALTQAHCLEFAARRLLDQADAPPLQRCLRRSSHLAAPPVDSEQPPSRPMAIAMASARPPARGTPMQGRVYARPRSSRRAEGRAAPSRCSGVVIICRQPAARGRRMSSPPSGSTSASRYARSSRAISAASSRAQARPWPGITARRPETGQQLRRWPGRPDIVDERNLARRQVVAGNRTRGSSSMSARPSGCGGQGQRRQVEPPMVESPSPTGAGARAGQRPGSKTYHWPSKSRALLRLFAAAAFCR